MLQLCGREKGSVESVPLCSHVCVCVCECLPDVPLSVSVSLSSESSGGENYVNTAVYLSYVYQHNIHCIYLL